MATLTSFDLGKITHVDLTRNGFWRLQPIGLYNNQQGGFLGLSLIYPPGMLAVGGSAMLTQATLASVRVAVATDKDSVERIAEKMLIGGNEEDDKARTKECFNLFKNNPRPPSDDRLNEDLSRAYELVSFYWQLRSWILSGYDKETSWEIGTYSIVGRP